MIGRFILTGVGILIIVVVRFVVSILTMMEDAIMSLQKTLDAARVRLLSQQRVADEATNALAEAEKLGLSASIVILTREVKRKVLACRETASVIGELEKALKKR